MSYTHGPWTYRLRPSVLEPGAIRDYADIDTADGMPVAVASFYSEDDTNEADARLIAAAPELLEAAKFALAVAESWIPDLYREGRSCELALKGLDPIRRAIAKATGESP